jgi:hypothetical protein
MATPPPQERFDPIFARWYTPGGPLYDPELAAVDPEHQLPVELVGPVPPELAVAAAEAPDEPTGSVPVGSGAATEAPDGRGGRRPARIVITVWVIVAMVAAGAAGLIMTTTTGYCPDPGECTIEHGGGPVGWAFAIGLVWLAIHAVRRALGRGSRRSDQP